MSQYTTTIDNLQKLQYDFGLRDYPIWNEQYRNVLNTKLLDHYRFREIGFETPALFKFYLNRTLNEIMPYFNELYATKLLEYNPLYNVDYTITHEKTNERNENLTEAGTISNESESSSTGTSSDSSETTGSTTSGGTLSNDKKTVSSDTPQSLLPVTNINGVTYASNITFDHDSNTTTGTETNTGTTSGSGSTTLSGTGSNDTTTSKTNTNEFSDTESFTQHLVGNYGVMSSQKLIQETRDLIVNIDSMVIEHEEIQKLFMLIY